MEKLKKIIDQTDAILIREFEATLKGTNSVKFHTLLTHYKTGTKSDPEIREVLDCTENSYYVLKSRLYDKVQKFLLENATPQNASADSGNLNLDQYLFEYPTETSIAMLQQLESKYIKNDSPSDLIHVYSALKKAHFHSDKYYHYSQLFNNQVAYALGLEKAEDTLMNFTRTLASYDFSDNPSEVGLMKLLVKEIKNIQSLYKSPRIEIIHHIIIIQTILFAGLEQPDEPPIEDLLKSCDATIKKYEHDKNVGYFQPVISFLSFEYYNSLNQHKKALTYYEEVDKNLSKFLLYSNNCLAYKFLFSALSFRTPSKDNSKTGVVEMMIDPNNLFANVAYHVYKAYTLYYEGKLKKAVSALNEILNDVSFKDVFFMESEIKLLISFLYIKLEDLDMADNVLRGLGRKLDATEANKYRNIKQAAKMLNLLVKGVDTKARQQKYAEAVEQFHFYNHKDKKVLAGLQSDLEKTI